MLVVYILLCCFDTLLTLICRNGKWCYHCHYVLRSSWNQAREPDHSLRTPDVNSVLVETCWRWWTLPLILSVNAFCKVSFMYNYFSFVSEMLILNSLFQVKKSGKCEMLNQEERKRQEVKFHISIPDFLSFGFAHIKKF